MSNLIDGVIRSSFVNREMPYRVLTPDDRLDPVMRFPVLYLLHGLFGDFENWTTLTDLQNVADGSGLIIVMPEGGDGWYTDAGEGRNFESYLIFELMPAIETRFRTIAAKSGRAIAGNSMGGYGAFKFALKYPDKFAFAASFSGAFHAPALCGPSRGANWDELGPSIIQAFGETGSTVRSENDLDILAVAAVNQKEDLPFFYFDCGRDDEFIGTNNALAVTFSKLGIAHEHHELAGGHDWDYWNSRIGFLLELARRKLVGPIET